MAVLNLARQRHCQPRRCGLPHKRPVGCLRDLQGSPGIPGLTRCSTVGRQCVLQAAQSPETGGEASSLSGRSDGVCTTFQLENRERERERERDRDRDMRHSGMNNVSLYKLTANTTADKLKSPDKQKKTSGSFLSENISTIWQNKAEDVGSHNHAKSINALCPACFS